MKRLTTQHTVAYGILMWTLRRPGNVLVERFLASQREAPFSYASVGATRGTPPSGYTIDRNEAILGHGQVTYERAVSALESWRHFDIRWIDLVGGQNRPSPGLTVAILARWGGTWFLNACRVVYLVNETAPSRRSGFAYGTLPDHAESGEELFTVDWQPDDSVWYRIMAFSRPNQVLSRLGYPLVRRLQKRFARESIAAMKRAIGSPGL